MGRFNLQRTDELTFECTRPLSEFYLLSPCVWKERHQYNILLRAVNRSEIAAQKVARIYYGVGESALHFTMDPEPVLGPGPEDDDKDGTEDPTLASAEGTYYVYYSGWNQAKREGHLLFATGTNLRHLTKRGRVFGSSSLLLDNAKEGTIVRAGDGTWRLFFEFAEGGKSKITCACSDNLGGPWEVYEPFFHCRPGSWDSWHLSTGPVWSADPEHPVMFYNGADRDAHWRIGWVEFDKDLSAVVRRGDDPIITPPRERRNPDDTDIAFAASVVEEDNCIGLYYSIADQYTMRAVIR